MPKIPFDQLVIPIQKRFKNQGFTRKENTGIDTETYQGYVKLIADDSGNYKFIENLDDILRFMTRNRFRNKFNWFYNIKYDFESIIKYLDNDQLYELYHEKIIEHHRYTIQYLDKKFIGIDFQGNKYYFYDLFNFLETSLNEASKKFLKDEKKDDVNASLLNTDLSYWSENEDKIILYIKKDALLTKQLADYFWNLIYQNLNYYPKRPFSKGKLSEEYFLSKIYIPTINDIPKGVLQYAYNSYSGGRFEILKRGYSNSVFVYDISSAYPYQMTLLLDFSKGKWINTIEVSEDIGFYRCKVSALEENFSPFMVKKASLNLYPNGKFFQYLSNKEILFIRENFTNCDIQVLDGYAFRPFEELYPYKEEIERLYKWKQTEKDADIKYCVKIILNSLYGKTIQTVAGRAGKLFNPIYASLITSGTRLKLLKMALQSPENIIAFSTDSVSSQTYLKSPKNPQLGDFTFEFQGEGVYIMSDIYTLWNREKIKNRFRGFKIYKDTIPSIIENIESENMNFGLLKILKSLDKNKTKYPYITNSPYHLGECLIHTRLKNPKMINIFHETKKDIDINGDIKRYWQRPFKNGKDALENLLTSYPIKL